MTTTAAESTDSRIRRLLGGTAGIAVAIAIMNVGTYGFQMVCARILGPGSFGAVASMLALLMVLAVVQLALQATAARRISIEPGDVASIERTVLSITWRAAGILTAVALALSPLTWHVLRLDGMLPAVVMALAVAPTTLLGGQIGVLQGERRWRALSAVYLSAGVPRVFIGLVFLLVSPTETSAMLAIFVSLWIPVLVGGWALRHRRGAVVAPVDGAVRRDFVRELGGSSFALLAFFALSNLDVVVARSTLDEHQAGLYAGGLIVTKAVLFLPQFAVVILFPSMSTESESRSAIVKGASLISMVGVAAAVGCSLLSGVALIFTGGAEYAEVQDQLWVFAALGGLLAVLQFLVYANLARRAPSTKYVVGAGVLALVGVGSTLANSIGDLLAVVAAVDVAVVAVLVVQQLVRHRQPATT